MNWKQCHDLLINGNYEEGWPEHGCIVTHSAAKGCGFATDYNKPVWHGEKEDIILLVNAEFGDGDTIHFLRFIEETKNRVKKVILRCNKDFKSLFYNFEIIGKEDELPYFDKIIHMMALPKVLGVKKSEISGKPYIRSNPDAMPQRATQVISALKFFKVGICWKGNPFNSRDILRSIPKELFSKLNVVDGFKFFNLTKIEEPPENFIDTRPLMNNWNDTANLIEYLDLIISVDTSVAHLAGAMGKPVWLLTTDVSEGMDWRWGKNGEETIWYESMKIFRRENSWESTLDKMAIVFKSHLKSLMNQDRPSLFCAPSAEIGTALS
jgi:hypothetical protein